MVYLNEHTDQLDLPAALAKVSAQRREQALRYRYESVQRLSLRICASLPPTFQFSILRFPFLLYLCLVEF